MAGRKPVTSRSKNIKSYRSHLLQYALKQKKTFQQYSYNKPFTFFIRFKQGNIFSKDRYWLTKADQFLQNIFFLFTALTLEFFHAIGHNTLLLFRKSWKLYKRSCSKKIQWRTAFSSISHTLKQHSNSVRSVALHPFVSGQRIVARWNRKKSWSFKRKLRKSFVTATQTPEKKSFSSTFAQVLVAPFKPFYLTVQLFPLQTIIALVLSTAIISSSYWVHTFIFEDLPKPELLTQQEPEITTVITDRDGEILYQLYKDENRTIIPLSEVSPNLVYATIAIEDKDFYLHQGFSLRGITRAIWSNYHNESIQGGSTITQQLVKNRLLTTERTFQRKFREIILAVMAERVYEKEEILEMYFNQIAYGGATYGAEAAAQRYFGKSASELNLPEAALLAGLPAAPSAYSPFGAYPETAKLRQMQVLNRMAEDGYISQEIADQAARVELAYEEDVINIQAPHFVMYVRQYLADQFGEEMLHKGGLVIRTSLDLSLHNKAQELVTNEVQSLAHLRVQNGATLVTNPKTGEILSMVGSTNYFDFENDGQVNLTMRPRQPGSSIKPLTYALALERGMSPNSIIQDQPTTFDIAGTRPYSPRNYDGKYRGNVTLKEALASSYNIPAVKLLNQIGVGALIDKAEAMGITTWGERTRFGLSLTLGGGEVLMTDMAKLYGVFANQGYAVNLQPILEIRTYKGELVFENSCALTGMNCDRRKVLNEAVAYQISNMLSDNNARAPAFGPQSTLFIPDQEVAVKTGTTNNLRDNWTIGYTSDRVVATWVGNNDNQPMSYVASGVTGASPIWNSVVRLVLDTEQPHRFAMPQNLIKVAICASTGTLPCSGCSRVVEEYFVPGTEPTVACNIAAPVSMPSPVRED
ncbi:MAG: PBP1A family penicillin-binding protein [Patescibacteria group bacterium]